MLDIMAVVIEDTAMEAKDEVMGNIDLDMEDTEVDMEDMDDGHGYYGKRFADTRILYGGYGYRLGLGYAG